MEGHQDCAVILKLADRDDLLRIELFLKNLLTSYCGLYSVVQAALRSNRSSSYRVFYALDDDSDENNSFAAIVGLVEEKTQLKTTWCSSSWSTNEKALMEIYKNMKAMFQWTKDNFAVYSVNSYDQQNLVDYFHEESRRSVDLFSMEQYVMDTQTASQIQMKIPDEVYVDNLKPCHAEMVYDNWPYRSLTSGENMAHEIELFPSAGVFMKETNQLVSWVMLHPPFGMARLHTAESHRRRGYGTLAVQYLAKRMAETGYLPMMSVVVGNSSSSKLALGAGLDHFQTIQCFELSSPDEVK